MNGHATPRTAIPGENEVMSTPEHPDIPPYDAILARTGRIAGLNRCWEEILHHATRRDFEKDAVIPHTRWRGMYYLARGSVSIAYIAACGRERLTLRVGPGCLFNEARSVSNYEPGVVFQCLEPSEIWRFPQELLQDTDFLSAYPRQVASLLHSMGIKILIHYTFLADMGTGSRESHVCRFILNLSRQNGNAPRFPCPMRQQDVAALLGIHRATLARILRQLKDKGIIAAFSCKEVRISDARRLEELALNN